MIYLDGLYQGYRNRNANDFFGIPIQSNPNGGNPPTIRNAVLTQDGTTLQSFDVGPGAGQRAVQGVRHQPYRHLSGRAGREVETGNAVFTPIWPIPSRPRTITGASSKPRWRRRCRWR